MKKIIKLPTIIGIIVLIGGLAAGVLLIQYRQIFKLGASPDTTPQDVKVTNISDKSFTVSWITDKPTVGYLNFGETGSPDQTARDTESIAKNIHQVIVLAAKPSTNYFFKINSDGVEMDNSGIPWKTKTGPAILAQPDSKIISGAVMTAGGRPAGGILVYVNASGMSPISTRTSAGGTWIIPIGTARTSDLAAPINLASNPLLEIFVQGGADGVSSAQIYTNSANPVPNIILGQTHNFKDQPANNTDSLPKANVDIPEDSNQSGFDVPQGTDTSQTEAVTLDSVTAGEVIQSTKPEFFGEGPASTKITITVESDPITDSVTVGTNGQWNWEVPQNLEPGNHTVTLSWKDAAGIARTLTRTFVVSAAEGPAFEASSSASPSTTPKASPTSTPKASATPRVSATPKITLPATDSGTPVAGSLTPTIALSIMGIGLLAIAVFSAKKAFQ